MNISVGSLILGDKVDITDPCYDKDVWCRMTTKCEPGEYQGFAEVVNGEYGTRVSSLCIIKKGANCSLKEYECIGSIGVDAGLAGFFNNKPDFNDEEWREFCAHLDFSKDQTWNDHNGIYSESGYGDGEYNVYANKDRNAFTIRFI